MNLSDRRLLKVAGVLLLVSSLAACVSKTSVVPAGKDTYIIAGDDAMDGVSGNRIKTGLYQEASSYCEARNKKIQPLDESVSSYAAELRFRCLDVADPEYIRAVMESVPDIKIEAN